MRFIDDNDHRTALNAPLRAMLSRCRPITFATISRALNSKATPLVHIRSNRSSFETKDEIFSVNAGAFDLKTHSKDDELENAVDARHQGQAERDLARVATPFGEVLLPLADPKPSG